MGDQLSGVMVFAGVAAVLISAFLLVRTSTGGGYGLWTLAGFGGLTLGVTILAGKALKQPDVQIIMPQRPALLQTSDVAAETRFIQEVYWQAVEACELEHGSPPPIVQTNRRYRYEPRRAPQGFVDGLVDRQARCMESARTFSAMQPPASVSPEVARMFRSAFRTCSDAYTAGANIIGQVAAVALDPANRTLNAAVRSSVGNSPDITKDCHTAFRKATAKIVYPR